MFLSFHFVNIVEGSVIASSLLHTSFSVIWKESFFKSKLVVVYIIAYLQESSKQSPLV